MASSSSAGVASGTESEGEEQEDPSSSLALAVDALEDLSLDDDEPTKESVDELSAFRQQWRRELGTTPSPQRELGTTPSPQRGLRATSSPQRGVGATPSPQREVGATPSPQRELGATPSPRRDLGATPSPQRESPARNPRDDNKSNEGASELATFRQREPNTIEPSVDDKSEGLDELSAFRQQWQRELEGTPSPQRQAPAPAPEELDEPPSEEEKAKQLFRVGVELERRGKLYEAIQHYKRAMQILPDVERRLYESVERADTEEETITEGVVTVEEREEDDEEVIEGEDLFTRLQRIQGRKGVLCEPANPAKECHFAWLPYEVVLLIMRWVVSSELDAVSLERLATTSRGLYVAARQQQIWRAMCIRAWGSDCGSPRALGLPSWRQMFLRRPRLLLHGCYISKTTYLRAGENSFQDQSYRPWYLIDYYRYLRFFSDGVVLMWTTPEEPAGCVGQLKHRTRLPPGALCGHYRLVGDKVVIIVKKSNDKKPAQTTNTRFRSRRKETHEHHETIFHLELQIRTIRGRGNWQLAWRGYSVSTRREQWTQFELSPAKFPPFAFSRVRAYTTEASAPLA